MNFSFIRDRRSFSDFIFILWAGGAALLSYSLVYALRKPFTAATFDGLSIWGMDYKVVVTITQILGYLLAKFIGIKLISELKGQHRLKFTDNQKNLYEHYNLKPYVISYIDTMLFADKLGMPKKIKDLAESLDLEVTNHHDPEFDAKLCALIFGELTDKYPSYQELIRKIDDQPKTNNNYFNQPSEDVLEENEEHLSNYQITQNELENIDLIGKGIVITGNFSIEREEIKTFLMKIGGQIKSGITGKVDFVFAGEDCGWSKIQKINDLNQSKKANIRILNEADLNYLIKKYGI